MQSLSPRALDSLSGLVKLGDEIDQWDSCEQKNPKLFLSLLNLASSIAGSAARHLLQVDTRMSLAGSQVSHLIAAEMANSVEYMLRLSPLNSPYVDNFRTEFERRYQMNREVPILELLSPTFGLGSPYDLQLLSRGQTVTERRRNNRLGRIAAEALRSNSNVYRLTNEDLEQLSFWRPASAEAPISVDIFAMISANTRDDIDAGKFEIVLPSRIGENGGGRTLGRFAQLIGSEAMETLTDIARYEALLDPDSIHADVSYLPQESRVANLTIAPIVRRHTIVSNQIPVTNSCNVPLSEIVIGIQNNRFYARWTRTNQRVLAHSNNMLNPAFAPGAIRFLLDIATDGQPQIVPFQWGPVESFPFLPRVVVGKTVLKLAQWDTSALVLKGRDSSTFNERLVAWRTAWRVPRTVQVCSNRIGDDNYLLLDLEKSNDMQLFEEMLKRSSLLVQEYIPCDRWHTTVDGNYATEIVATFVRTDLVAATNKIPYKAKKIEKPSHSECVQTIGSEWVYLKIPCHKTVQDNIILRVQELTKSMQGQGYLTSWFFLRYPEGNEHLRVRFKVKKESLYSHVLPLIFDWSSELVLKSKLSHGVSLETYDREIERYGGSSGIVVAENIFGVDSKLVARLISLQIMKKLDRTVLGVVSVNNFLNGLGLDLSSKINWLRRISRPDSKKVASTKFRESKELFYNLLVCNYSDPNAFRYAEVNAELLAMQGDLAKLGRELKQLEEDGDLSVPVQDLIGSFVHMHCVRLFGVDRDNDYFILALLANSLEMLANRQLRDQPASIGPSDINLTHCEH
ncbi:MAG: lantibiotic biosynthesis protein [Cyanobacteriota bacterium erpe_2018_sw_21hr_WHONDRS-SW48-000092_B_bin.40]|jgi:thiopeptide-type bacteriocin biosynthesis protein|nr:lantibiotic biosynthesis protein [Cyanobacteriota bacterium erpe_2018_sw_21hr_WHONDRS-SW48-000092_B_bin.40]